MNDPIRTRVPHPFPLLLGAVFVAMIMTWVIPAGEFDRQLDPATEVAVVIAGVSAVFSALGAIENISSFPCSRVWCCLSSPQ